jgi:hypothetical protein
VINNEKIVELATLMHKVDQLGEGDEADAFQRELDQINSADTALVIFAGKMLEGKPYSITSDDPEGENMTRHRALAQHLGATEELFTQGAVMTQIIFRPPARQ